MSDIGNWIVQYSGESFEEFLEKRLNNKRQACLLKIKNGQFKEVENLYKTTIFIFESKQPNYQTFVSHGVREIINEITRSYKGHDKTEKEKFQQFLKINTPNTRDATHFSTQLFEIKNNLFNSVHQALRNLPNEQYDQYFFEFENILYDIFASSFIDRQKEIGALVDSDPTPENTKKVQKHFHYKGVKHYFFCNLTNPEWIEPLIEGKLISIPASQISENGNYVRIFWNESIYLKKIANQKPDQVFQVIKPFLQQVSNQSSNFESNINLHNQEIFNQVLAIGKNFPPENSDYKKQIGEAFKNWLNKSELNGFVDIQNIKEFLKDLFACDQEQLVLDKMALGILEAILKLEMVKKEYGKEFKTRFIRDGGMDDYYYEEILKIISEDQILNFKNAYKIFSNLYFVLKNAIFTNSTKFTAPKIDAKFCDRCAIEEHSQDQYERGPDYRLVSAIRYVAEYIFKNNLETKEVIEELEKKQNDYEVLIFTRIILHLLREFPANKKDLISKKLTNESYFRSLELHHEYYLLLEQEFKNLDKEDKEIILGFIDAGSGLNNEGIDPNEHKKYQEGWRFRKLYCIKDGLFGKWKAPYQELSKKFKAPEHPEFLFDIDSTWVGSKSAISQEEIADKNIDEIIKYLKKWMPQKDDLWHGTSISGLADVVKEDAEKNPKKYLNDLDKFKDIEEPAYISHLLRGLSKFSEGSLDNWKQIINFGKIIANKEIGEILSKDEKTPFDGEKSWDQSKRELIRIFSETFTNKEAEKTLSLDFANDIFEILSNLTLPQDFYLEQKDIKSDEDDRYYIRAINSCHGEAFSTLIKYGLWLRRNKKEKQASKQITPILDNLIKNSKYQETWSIFGRYLPWLMLINEKWAKDNIDNIFPENDRKKFDPAWLTYVNFVNSFDSVFDLIKGKYLYVLENNLYQKDLKKDRDSPVARHIAIFYARKKIEIGEKIITAIFNDKNIFEAKELIRFIGRFTSNEKDLLESVIIRFQELWNWYIANIQDSHPKILQQFFFWYGSGKFEKKWAIENFIKILNQYPDLKITFFHVEERLIEDISNFIDEISAIAPRIIFSDEFDPYGKLKDFAKSYFEYIETYGREADKKTATELKNKFCEKYHFDENLEPL